MKRKSSNSQLPNGLRILYSLWKHSIFRTDQPIWRWPQPLKTFHLSYWPTYMAMNTVSENIPSFVLTNLYGDDHSLWKHSIFRTDQSIWRWPQSLKTFHLSYWPTYMAMTRPSPRDGSPTAWGCFGVFQWPEGLPEFLLLAGTCWRSMLKKLLLANKTNIVSFKIENVPEPWNEICVSSVCV